MEWMHCKTTDFSPTEYEQVYAALSASRKMHVDRLRQQGDKTRSLAGELVLQKLLKERFGVFDAVLHRREDGAPYLSGSSLCVSIAHCEDMVVCAVHHAPVGIDVERVRPIALRAAQMVCTEEELSYLLPDETSRNMQLPCTEASVLHRFFELWTGKEAYFKKTGAADGNLRNVNILPLERHLCAVEDFLVQII